MKLNRQISVLIIDDDIVFRASLSEILKQEESEWLIHEADSVKTAIAAMKNTKIDIAIVDVNLPDGTAIDIITNAGQIPCMLCTQEVRSDKFRDIFEDARIEANNVGYLVKPVHRAASWSIRDGLMINEERKTRNQLVSAATARFENEKMQISRNLHDASGAYITQLNWVYQGIETRVAQLCDQEVVKKEINEFCRQGKKLLDEMRAEISTAVSNLRSEIISVAGLFYGLEYLIDEWRGAAPDVTFETHISKDVGGIDIMRNDAIFRLVQEGITNAMKHGKPDFICLEMNATENNIELILLSRGEVIEKDKYELTVLRERTSSLGGTLKFECNAFAGASRLEVNLPN